MNMLNQNTRARKLTVLAIALLLCLGSVAVFLGVSSWQTNRAFRELGTKLGLKEIPPGQEGNDVVKNYVLCDMLPIGEHEAEILSSLDKLNATYTVQPLNDTRESISVEFEDTRLEVANFYGLQVILEDGELRDKFFVYASDFGPIECDEK